MLPALRSRDWSARMSCRRSRHTKLCARAANLPQSPTLTLALCYSRPIVQTMLAAITQGEG